MGSAESCQWRPQQCLPKSFPKHCCDEDESIAFPTGAIPIDGHLGLRIFHFNDVYILDHLPALKAHVQALGRASGAQNVITTLAGDFVAPSMLSAIDHGAGMVACLNDIPVDYCCFGNHESDIPYESLICRIGEFQGKWINSNMQGFEKPAELDHQLEEYCVVEPLRTVHGRTVALLGLNVANRAMYRKGAFNGAAETLEPVLECAKRMVDKIKSDIPDVDCIIPLTHQDLKDDIALAETGLFPLILGGHDHFVHHSSVNNCVIAKAGEDAKNVFKIDLYWDTSAPVGSKPTVSAELIPLVAQKGLDTPLRDIQPDSHLKALVEHRMLPVVELQAATLASFKDRTTPLTSINARVGPNSMGTLLATALRDATRADAGVINAGSVRGNKEYTDGLFTFAHLSAEVPFPSANIVILVDGKTISEAVKVSRETWINKPGSEVGSALHTDEDMLVDPGTGEVLTIGKLALQPDKLYNLVVDAYIVRKNVAFKAYAAQYPDRIPPDDAGQPAMPCLVTYFCRLAWAKLASSGQKGKKLENVTEEDVEELVRLADTSGDANIDFEELLVVLEQALGAEMSSRVLARQMMNLADVDGDGMASVADLCLILQESLITQGMDTNPTPEAKRQIRQSAAVRGSVAHAARQSVARYSAQRASVASTIGAPVPVGGPRSSMDSMAPMMPGRLSRFSYANSAGTHPGASLALHQLQEEGPDKGIRGSMMPMTVGSLPGSSRPSSTGGGSNTTSPAGSHALGTRGARQSVQLASMCLEQDKSAVVVGQATNFLKFASQLGNKKKGGK